MCNHSLTCCNLHPHFLVQLLSWFISQTFSHLPIPPQCELSSMTMKTYEDLQTAEIPSCEELVLQKQLAADASKHLERRKAQMQLEMQRLEKEHQEKLVYHLGKSWKQRDCQTGCLLEGIVSYHRKPQKHHRKTLPWGPSKFHHGTEKLLLGVQSAPRTRNLQVCAWSCIVRSQVIACTFACRLHINANDF